MAPNSRTKGFTLMEILVVAAIMGLLVAIGLPAWRGARERTLTARARAELALLAQMLEDYRRLYGDYPQTGDFLQAAADPGQPLSTSHAQAKVFNALAGVFGPRDFSATARLNGFDFIGPTRFTLEFPRDEGLPAPAGGAGQRIEQCTSVLDPWGRRYLYYYKCASDPGAWRAGGYILYSAGPDGRDAPPDGRTGVDPQDSAATAANADNVSAQAPGR